MAKLGRRAGFRCQWGQPRGGSIPLLGNNDRCVLNIYTNLPSRSHIALCNAARKMGGSRLVGFFVGVDENFIAMACIGFLVLVGCYLIGSVLFSVVFCKLLGKPDPRSGGSKNPGVTNVLRIGGKLAGVLCLVGDVGKGVLAMVLVAYVPLGQTWMAIAFGGVVLGHLYPIFHGFKGGKGVAVLLGGLLTIDFTVGLVFVGVWVVIVAITRYVAVGSVGACISPSLCFAWFDYDWVMVMVASILGVMVFLRHRENFSLMLAAKEDKCRISALEKVHGKGHGSV